MADCITKTRSNYFHVKDEDAFRAFMERVYGSDKVKVEQNAAGAFAFFCNGEISGLKNAACDEDDDAAESAYDEFTEGLRTHVADNDAIIITTIGYEKLCYLYGTVEIITAKDGWVYTDLANTAIGIARDRLGDPMWTTQNAY